jgi:hypothetical protein
MLMPATVWVCSNHCRGCTHSASVCCVVLCRAVPPAFHPYRCHPLSHSHTQMLEARSLIVRSKLMLPDGKGNSGWTTTQLVHLPRYAPRLAIGSEAIIRVSEGGGLIVWGVDVLWHVFRERGMWLCGC